MSPPTASNRSERLVDVHHDEDAEVYLNGVLAARLSGFTADYELVRMRPRPLKALKPARTSSPSTAARPSGGQYIDVGLSRLSVVP